MTTGNSRHVAFQLSCRPFPTSRFNRSTTAQITCSVSRREDADNTASDRSRGKGTEGPSQATSEGRKVSEIKVGDEFIGTVCDVGPAQSSWIDIGAVTITGKPVRARLRHGRSGKAKSTEVVGGVIPVYVHKISPESARIEVRRGSYQDSLDKGPDDSARMLQSLNAGERLVGTVVAVGHYGAVVDVNVMRRGKKGHLVPALGLLPRKLFKKEWASEADTVKGTDTERILKCGDEVEIWVRAVHVQNAFLLLDSVEVDTARLEQERITLKRNFRKRGRRASPASLTPGEQRYGVVRNVQKFGLFVDIGLKRDGLIHYSEMGERHKWDWMDTLDVGTRLKVEVLKVEENRISLRLVSVPEEEEAEILSRARSPTARVDDLEQAHALTSSRARPNAALKASQTVADSGAYKTRENIRLQEADDADSESKRDSQRKFDSEDDSGDVGDEAVPDKFSDEYFEDKYGY